jgi:hypothetical protein
MRGIPTHPQYRGREDFLFGFDFGKRRDNAAIIGLRRTPLPNYVAPTNEEAEDDPLLLRIIHAQLAPLHTEYHALAEHAAHIAQRPRYQGRVQFVLDVNGPGEPAVEIFERQPGLEEILWLINTSAGQTARRVEKTMRFSVPKKDLKDAVKVNLQRRRLVANPLDAHDMEALRLQLFAFKMKVKAGKVTMEAQTESDHDDLVMALAMPVWLSGQLPLEERDGEPAGQPGVLLPGPTTTVDRPAPSWRDGPVMRPAGTPPIEPGFYS